MVGQPGVIYIIVLAGLVAIGVVWVIPKLQARHAKANLSETELPMAENEFRKTIVQIVGGLVVLTGFFFTWQELNDSRENFGTTLKLQEQGRITERLTKATEQLNDDDHLAARLGGVYALKRILRESPDTQDRDHVTEILAAFLREHVPAASVTYRDRISPPRDVVSAFGAIAGRPLDNKEVSGRLRDATSTAEIDLRGLNLSHLYPRGTSSRRPNLSFLDLECSNLEASALIFSDMIDVDLGQANLRLVDLSNADLRKAILDEANLGYAQLTNADLERATMTGAILAHVNLQSTRNLTQQQVDAACMDEYTRQHLPGGLKAPNPCQEEYRGCPEYRAAEPGAMERTDTAPSRGPAVHRR